MHGVRMPAQVHRVNAVRAGVVKWTTGWRSGWSGSNDLHHGGRARTTLEQRAARRAPASPAKGEASVADIFPSLGVGSRPNSQRHLPLGSATMDQEARRATHEECGCTCGQHRGKQQVSSAGLSMRHVFSKHCVPPFGSGGVSATGSTADPGRRRAAMTPAWCRPPSALLFRSVTAHNSPPVWAVGLICSIRHGRARRLKQAGLTTETQRIEEIKSPRIGSLPK